MSNDQFSARRASLCIAAVLGLIVGLRPAVSRAGEEEDFQKLSSQVRAAYRAADYKKALELSQKMHELRPKALDPMYNIACMHCLLGENDKAYEWLEKVVDAGWTDDDQMSSDWDLRTIRGEKRFRDLLSKVRDRNRGKAGERTGDKKSDDKSDEKPAKRDTDDDEQDEKPAKREMTPQERQARVNELTAKVIQASEAGEREKALKLAEEALEVADIGLTNYNVACMHSLMNHKDEAFKYLDRAIERGMGDGMVQQIEGDADFDNVRKDPRYAAAVKKAKEKSGTAREQGRSIQPRHKVTLPADHDKSKKAPLIVALHGRGGNMNEITERWKKAADEMGAILLAPQGTFQQDGGGISWGNNLNQIEDNVMNAIDEVQDEYKVDGSRIILTGFSQGGWVTYALALRNPDTFCGIIPVGAARFAPESNAALSDSAIKKLRVYIMIGEDDRDEFVQANKDAASRLEKAGAKVKLVVYDDLGHEFPKDTLKEQIKALKWVMGE